MTDQRIPQFSKLLCTTKQCETGHCDSRKNLRHLVTQTLDARRRTDLLTKYCDKCLVLSSAP